MQTETLVQSPISSNFINPKPVEDIQKESIVQCQKPIKQKLKSKTSKKVSKLLKESKNEQSPLQSAAIPITKNSDFSFEKNLDSDQSHLDSNSSHSQVNSRRNKRAVKRPGSFGPDFVCPMELENIPKKPKKKRAVEKVQEIVETRIPDPGIFCLCKGIDDGIRPMIQCKTCEDWFHFDCVGLQENNVPEEYLCPNCSKQDSKPKVSKITQPVLNKPKEIHKMSGLDLLIFAMEQYESQSGRKPSTPILSHCKEKTLSSQDSEHSIDENKEIEPEIIKFDQNKRKSLSKALNLNSKTLSESKYF